MKICERKRIIMEENNNEENEINEMNNEKIMKRRKKIKWIIIGRNEDNEDVMAWTCNE